MKQTIAVDFDGVIHKYSEGWKDGSIYDEPIQGAKEALKALSESFTIVVFTSRKNICEISRWMLLHDLYFDEVTNTKPIAVAYIDDRAIRFTDWTNALVLLMRYVQYD